MRARLKRSLKVLFGHINYSESKLTTGYVCLLITKLSSRFEDFFTKSTVNICIIRKKNTKDDDAPKKITLYNPANTPRTRPLSILLNEIRKSPFENRSKMATMQLALMAFSV